MSCDIPQHAQSDMYALNLALSTKDKADDMGHGLPDRILSVFLLSCHQDGYNGDITRLRIVITDSYVVSYADNMWFGDGAFAEAYHPNPYAPACVPCNHSMDTSELTVPRPMGCPCRPELLCQADLNQSIFPDVSKYCGIPRSAAMADCSSSTSNIQTCSDRSNLYRCMPSSPRLCDCRDQEN